MPAGYLSRIKFLVVEDNLFMRQIIRRVLKALEAEEVRECSDGAEALKILQTFVPDIVITDWEMTPINGIELTKMLRTVNDSFNPFIPIIMLTAHSEISRIVEARDAGVNEFVVKPISVKALFARIQSVIEKPRQFVKIGNYFGPDRRRKKHSANTPERRSDLAKEAGDDKLTTTLPKELQSGEPQMSQGEVNDFMNPDAEDTESDTALLDPDA